MTLKPDRPAWTITARGRQAARDLPMADFGWGPAAGACFSGSGANR